MMDQNYGNACATLQEYMKTPTEMGEKLDLYPKLLQQSRPTHVTIRKGVVWSSIVATLWHCLSEYGATTRLFNSTKPGMINIGVI